MTDQILTNAEHQRNVLMEAIHQTALDIGLCNKDIPPTGPHLLMFCQDFTSIIKDQEAKIAELTAQLEATQAELSNSKIDVVMINSHFDGFNKDGSCVFKYEDMRNGFKRIVGIHMDGWHCVGPTRETKDRVVIDERLCRPETN